MFNKGGGDITRALLTHTHTHKDTLICRIGCLFWAERMSCCGSGSSYLRLWDLLTFYLFIQRFLSYKWGLLSHLHGWSNHSVSSEWWFVWRCWKAERAGADRIWLFCICIRRGVQTRRRSSGRSEALRVRPLPCCFPNMLQVQILAACCLVEESGDDYTAAAFPSGWCQNQKSQILNTHDIYFWDTFL